MPLKKNTLEFMENFSISHSELIHYQLQAFIREYNCSDIEYLGLRNGEHWYRISEHEVNVKDIESLEPATNEQSFFHQQ